MTAAAATAGTERLVDVPVRFVVREIDMPAGLAGLRLDRAGGNVTGIAGRHADDYYREESRPPTVADIARPVDPAHTTTPTPTNATNGGTDMSAPAGGGGGDTFSKGAAIVAGCVVLFLAIMYAIGAAESLSNGKGLPPLLGKSERTQTYDPPPGNVRGGNVTNQRGPRMPASGVRSSPGAIPVAPDQEIRYTGRACTRSDGSIGAQGFSPDGQPACYRF